MQITAAILFVTSILVEVKGHGYLAQPAQRSSAWRFGFGTPPNYNDMELFCGGVHLQWNVNDGKCGVCGDPYNATDPNNTDKRPNEAGGKYALGVITGRYDKGSIIEVTVTLTAYHMGWFEFRLCAHNDFNTVVSQDCLDQTLLSVAATGETRIDLERLNIGAGNYVIQLQLPAGVTCWQCVLQWKYHAGNSWGLGPDGVDCPGCGPQENFVNCADIEIKESTAVTPLVTSSTSMINTDSQTSASTTPLVTSSTPTSTTTSPTSTTTSPTSTTTSPTSTTTTPSVTEEKSGADCAGDPAIYRCDAIGGLAEVPGMGWWCEINCRMSPPHTYCPDGMCHCFC